MAETKAPSTPSPKKKRSPVERAIVWGLIGILLGVALWEGWARFGYEQTLDRWQEAIAAAETSPDGSLKLAEAEEMMLGFPSKSAPEGEGARKTITYRWNSLFKRNYQIAVTYGGEPPDVLGLMTPDAPEEEVAAPVAYEGDEEEDEGAETETAAGGGPPPMHSGVRSSGGPPMHSEARRRGEDPIASPAQDGPSGSTPSGDGPNLGRDPAASGSDAETKSE